MAVVTPIARHQSAKSGDGALCSDETPLSYFPLVNATEISGPMYFLKEDSNLNYFNDKKNANL